MDFADFADRGTGTTKGTKGERPHGNARRNLLPVMTRKRSIESTSLTLIEAKERQVVTRGMLLAGLAGLILSAAACGGKDATPTAKTIALSPTAATAVKTTVSTTSSPIASAAAPAATATPESTIAERPTIAAAIPTEAPPPPAPAPTQPPSQPTSAPAPTQAPPPPPPPPTVSSGGDSTYPCEATDCNCPDFPSHAEAQRVFVKHGGSPTNNWSKLDNNHDGNACETLP